MRTILLPIHIIGGLTAIVAGAVALYALKGMRLHRKSGMIFVYAMLTMASTGAVIAAIKSQPENVIGGMITLYMVTTGLLTMRRHDGRMVWVDSGAMVFGLVVASLSLNLAIHAVRSPTGRIHGLPPTPFFMFGIIGILAALGDLRMILARGLRGTHRLVRHLWRMCFALFIATGSFFLGQAKVFPKPIRILPLLAIPAFLPLVLMVYWLVRVLFTKWRPHRERESLAPRPLRAA
jgi:uncharacterized membrane protein